MKAQSSLNSEEAVADKEAYMMLLKLSNGLSGNTLNEECNPDNAEESGVEESAQEILEGDDGFYFVPHEIKDGSIGNTIHEEQCNQENTDEPGTEDYSSCSESSEDDPTYCPSGENDSILSDQFPFDQSRNEEVDEVPASSPLKQSRNNGVAVDVTDTINKTGPSRLPTKDPYKKPARSPVKRSLVDENDPATTKDADSSRSPPKKPYSKPYRLCIFCNTMKSKLAQHIANQHSNIDRVAAVLELPNKQKFEALDAFKKEGILLLNKEQAKLDQPSYHREKMTTCSTDLVMCNICSGFYSKRYIKRHTNICQKESESCPTVIPIPVNLLKNNDQ